MAADCLSRVFGDMTDETRLEFSQQDDEKDEFIITVNDGENENNTAQRTAPEVLLQQQQEDDAVVSMRCGAGSKSCAAAAASQQENHENIHRELLIAATTAAVTRAQAAQRRPETVVQSGGMSVESEEPRQLSAHTPIDKDLTADVKRDSVIEQEPSNEVMNVIKGDDLVELLPISSQDYMVDDQFAPMYIYLTNGELTGNEKVDKKILLTADQHFLEYGLMYKISLPRSRRQQPICPLTERLCVVPKAFRFDLLNHMHNFGHFGRDKLFLTLHSRYYWYSLFSDVKELVTSCDTCMKSKRNFAAKTAPLNPLEIPITVFEVNHTDHKSLARKTPSGKTAILVFVNAYSGWTCLEAVDNVSALLTAQVLIKRLVSQFGLPKVIISDSGSAFTAQIFQHIAKALKIKHKFSAVAVPRSNARAECVIKDVA